MTEKTTMTPALVAIFAISTLAAVISQSFRFAAGCQSVIKAKGEAMRRMRIVVSLALVVLTALGSFIIVGATEASPASTAEILKFYSGPIGHVGRFRGKLLCLCCD